MTEPYSIYSACKGEREPGHHRGNERRKHHPAQDVPARGAEQGARLLSLAVEILQYRLHRPHDEWQPDEGERHQDPEGREGDLNTGDSEH